MARFAPCGWALSAYEDLSNWLLELANIKPSVLEKHRTTLLNMAEMICELGASLEVEELVVEEVASSAGTRSKGKGSKSKVVKELEEEKYYDWLVHHVIAIFYKYLWSVVLFLVQLLCECQERMCHSRWQLEVS